MRKTASKGQQIEIAVGRNDMGKVFISTTIDGKDMGTEYPIISRLRPAVGDLTWRVGVVGLTDAQADELRSEIAATEAEVAADPTLQMDRLIKQYNGLVSALRGAKEDAEADYWQQHEAGDSDRGWQAKAAHKPQIEAAQQAVKQFEAEHEDVLAEIAKRKHEDVERFLATD